MGVEAIDHVQLAMPAGREEEARTFYGGLLGIPEQPKPPHLAARGGCWFESDEVKIHLGVEADFRPAKKAHPALLAAISPRSYARCPRRASRSSTTNRSTTTTGSTCMTRSATGWSCSNPSRAEGTGRLPANLLE